MSGNSESDRPSQVSTINREMKIFKCTGFRTVQLQDNTNHYKMYLSAFDDEMKFLRHIAGQKRYISLKVTMQNIARYNVLDSYFKSKMGNENDILRTVLELQQKFDAHLAKTLGERFKREIEQNTSTYQPAGSTEDMSDINNDIIDHHDECDNDIDMTRPGSTAVNISENNHRSMIK